VKYKAVIFDLFGTLVDSIGVAEYSAVLKKTSSILKIPHDDYMRLWNNTAERRATGVFRTIEENLEHICRELNIPATKSQIDSATQVRIDFMTLALIPRSGAIEVLSYIKSNGYKTALISNCTTEPPVIWPNTAFAPFFDAAVFSSTAGIQKPDARIFLLATDKMAVKPQDCLYIGDDSDNELNGALGVGMYPVRIRDRHETPDTHLNNWKNDWKGESIASLTEIPDLLK